MAFGLGAALALGLMAVPLPAELRALIAVNAFFAAYLALMLRVASRAGPEDLRRHAESTDEGVVLIAGMALFAVGVSLAAIVMVLGREDGAVLAQALALAAVPLGWSTVHTLAAFHYAHLYYGGAAEGLRFPRTQSPGPVDFLYAAFTIGMTAQVSDMSVTSTPMRKAVLAHSVAAFFYNTVILALAVNAALRLTG